MNWLERVHVPFLMKQHQEKDHAKNSIKRYFNDLFNNFMVTWTVLERRKLLKLCETAKLKTGEKYCLAFHPSLTFRDLQEMGGVKLKELKDHTNSIGGAWGADTWACLVKDDTDDFDNDSNPGFDNTCSKRALLVPVSVFPSTTIIKVCDFLGQNDDYRRFGADEETPSGVEEEVQRNSTQLPGSQALSIQLSSIDHPDITTVGSVANDDIQFDDLPPHHDTFDDSADDTFVEEARPNSLRSNLSMSMTNRREVTEIMKQDKTYYVCECGYSSAVKSAVSCHKCRSGPSVLFNCQECTKVCKNPGSLKRHMNKMHRNVQENADSMTSNTLSTEENSSNEKSKEADSSCGKCGKTLKNNLNLTRHMLRVHGEVSNHESISETVSVEQNVFVASEGVPSVASTDESTTSASKCDICGKTLKSVENLAKHKEKVHNKDVTRKKPLTNTAIEELLDASNDEHERGAAGLVPTESVPEQQPQGRRTRSQRTQAGRRRSLSLLRHKGRRK